MTNAPAIAFVTLGCPKNEVDSDRMAAAVTASSYHLVDDPSDADVVVLNTCAFIQPATEEAIDEFFTLHTEWRPKREGRRIVVAGCMPSRYGGELADAMPEADAFVPVTEEGRLLETLQTLVGRPAEAAEGPGRLVPGVTAYLKVSEGCDRRCAYCTIPGIRGPFVSAPLEALVAEARWLIAHGAREIVLVGQDIASWGVDLDGGADLAGLVTALDALEGDFRLRLMYVQPDGVTDALLAAIATATHVCHYLDIPLQHASASVLDAMGRTGSPEAHLTLIERIRDALPDVVLRTTVMAGFPGETEQDSRVLEEFIAEADLDYVGVFAYSPEDGTRAATLPEQVDSALAEERAQRLRDIGDVVGSARAERRVGSVQRVLVEGLDEDGELVGRTCGQAPEVDGITFVEADAQEGSFLDLRITGSAGYDLIGEAL
ncbi:MAG: 30S ribosomal protein S12 methylthiotransferase RimO [Coriobacteriia bacterium]